MVEVDKEKLRELNITPFDLTPTKLEEMDQLMVAGHPIIDNKQQPLQWSSDQCKKLLGIDIHRGKCKKFNYLTICTLQASLYTMIVLQMKALQVHQY